MRGKLVAIPAAQEDDKTDADADQLRRARGPRGAGDTKVQVEDEELIEQRIGHRNAQAMIQSVMRVRPMPLKKLDTAHSATPPVAPSSARKPELERERLDLRLQPERRDQGLARTEQ